MIKLIKHQFSLVELLVIIAIIAILMSLLIPGLGRAKKASLTAVSINNLNQIYKAAMLYADNNDKKLCKSHLNSHSAGGDGVDWPRMFFENIFGNFSDVSGTAKQQMANDSTYIDLMFCPVLKGERLSSDQHADGRSSYSMNNYFSKEKNNYKLTYVGMRGKSEPYIMPGTSSNNKNQIQADANLEGSKYNLDHGYPAYSYNNQKTFGLYIDGRIEFLSVTHGSSIDNIMSKRKNFE